MTDVTNPSFTTRTGQTFSVYSASVKENYTKKLTNITPPQSTANINSGPKKTKIVDLLRVERRFTVTGHIDRTDASKCRALLTEGKVGTFTWNSETLNVNIDKLDLDWTGDQEQDEVPVTMTLIVGEDI